MSLGGPRLAFHTGGTRVDPRSGSGGAARPRGRATQADGGGTPEACAVSHCRRSMNKDGLAPPAIEARAMVRQSAISRAASSVDSGSVPSASGTGGKEFSGIAGRPRYRCEVRNTRPVSQSTPISMRLAPPCTVTWPPDELPSGAKRIVASPDSATSVGTVCSGARSRR